MRLKISTLIDLSTRAAQVIIKYNEIYKDRSDAIDKPLKSRKVVKNFEELSKVEKLQRPKKLQKSLVQKNVYKSINLLFIKYKELKLPLEL